MDRAAASEAEGCGFESRRAYVYIYIYIILSYVKEVENYAAIIF